MPLLPARIRALERTAQALSEKGYTARKVSRALGILAWNAHDMDGPWWARDNYADGDLGLLVDLFIRGARVPRPDARAVLPEAAWEAGLLREHRGDALSNGTLVPLGEDLIWTDRPERSSRPDGLFLPDSTSLALRGCLPMVPVGRHLDLGAGAGTVAMRAARVARQTIALDLNPRSAEACLVSAVLSGVQGLEAHTLPAEEAVGLGRFDRVTFALPLLVPVGHPESTPIPTLAADNQLLSQVIGVLPRLLAPGGLSLFYCQSFVGEGSLSTVLQAAFDGRPFRAVLWRDHEGPPPAGVLAVRADIEGGFAELPFEGPEFGDRQWWPHLAPLLGEQAVR